MGALLRGKIFWRLNDIGCSGYGTVMQNFLKIKDSRGKFSWTHALAIPIVVAVTIKLLASGVDLVLPTGYHVILASMSASDYVDIVKYWIGLFLARETTEKVLGYLGKQNGSGTT